MMFFITPPESEDSIASAKRLMGYASATRGATRSEPSAMAAIVFG
jgi:hypothetical protein